MRWITYIILALFTIHISCKKLEPKAPEEDETLDGPLKNLSNEQRAMFLRGDRAFNEDVFTKENGLGPLFVSTSCGSCHAGDGKGHPFTTLTRFGQVDEQGNLFTHAGGPQLQNRAIPGHQPETIPTNATFSKFTPPANSGLGFLDAVTDADIIAMSDPNDADGDGISGAISWITLKNYINPRQGSVSVAGKHIGRFGKKAAAYNLLQQTAAAYNQDMGITSTYEPYDTYSNEEVDPEVSNQTIQDVVFYLRTLKAPVPRLQEDESVIAGKTLFTNINCSKCHIPELRTGISNIGALSNQTFMPYTDLLLHDMGKALDDGYTEGGAKTYEWRTPPLWGLGLSKISQGGNYYLLHDGRARSIEEAILLHGGEATNSCTKYKALSEQEKKKLIAFLESL